MRALGVSVLGLFCGLFVGFLTTEVIAVIALGSDGQLPDSMPLTLLLGYLTPVFAIAGIVVALLVDSRIRRRGGDGRAS